MSKARVLRSAIVVAMLAAASTAAEAASPRPSSMEPPRGTLQFGQSMMVDDGTCPVGQIKKVTEGNMTSNARIRACVARRRGG